MTIDNMRALGVRSVEVTCQCGRQAIVDVSADLFTLDDHLQGAGPTRRIKYAEAARSTKWKIKASTKG